MSDYMLKHLGPLVGKKVEAICHDNSTPGEEFFGLKFSDGSIAWILCDPEGNGPGHLEIQTK